MNKEIEQLKKDIESVRSENNRLKKDLSDAKKERPRVPFVNCC